MLYATLKPIVRLAMAIFCRRIIINKPDFLKRKGPLLLACNHPNSFLDAAILADLFRYPVYSLARGDVFKKPLYIRLLTALRILPVYRTSEGVENLGINYETFDACRRIFEQDGIVLIFSEGRCINEWHLRPLMKGTARLAFSSWEQNIPLQVLPVGINYSSFRRFGKNVFINFGEVISYHDFDFAHADGKRYQAFNASLQSQLQHLVFEIEKNDLERQKQLLEMRPSLFARIVLFIPAAVGWLFHAPLYIPIQNFTIRKTNNNDHHDSILMALLLVAYPLYLLVITLIILLITHQPAWLLMILVMPFTAWSYAHLKGQLDK